MYAVENTGGKLRQRQSGRHTERDGNCRQGHALAHNEALNRADRRTKRQADADLTGATTDGVAHDSIESDRRQYEPGGTEHSEQHASQSG